MQRPPEKRDLILSTGGEPNARQPELARDLQALDMTGRDAPAMYEKKPLSEHVAFGFLMPVLFWMALFYNAGLAFININIMPLSAGMVMLAELAVLAGIFGFLVAHWQKIDALPVHGLALMIFLLLFLWAALLNEQLNPKPLRDILLIPLFMAMGGLFSHKMMLRTLQITLLAVVGVMALEALATTQYVALFNPAKYYLNTRGVAEFEFSSVDGLYAGATGYAGRFSLGVFDTHRLSSLFLEQVSLANFAMVMALVTCALWKGLNWRNRAFFAVSIFLMIATNHSRTGTFFVCFMAMGYFLFPLLTRSMRYLIMPGILLLCALFFYDPHFQQLEDNLSGRMGLTMDYLSDLSLPAIFGAEMNKAYHIVDSGYANFIYMHSLFGLLAFWLYTAGILPADSKMAKRFTMGALLYISINLLIGSAIFSIKAAAPLWLVAGYLLAQQNQARQQCIMQELR